MIQRRARNEADCRIAVEKKKGVRHIESPFRELAGPADGHAAYEGVILVQHPEQCGLCTVWPARRLAQHGRSLALKPKKRVGFAMTVEPDPGRFGSSSCANRSFAGDAPVPHLFDDDHRACREDWRRSAARAGEQRDRDPEKP
jgi:hypothetical protein